MNQTTQSDTPRTDALSSDPAIERRDVPIRVWREMERLERENRRLRAALTDLEQALLMDSHDKTILADTVEYHLDGQAMYHALNKARAALAKVSDSA